MEEDKGGFSCGGNDNSNWGIGTADTKTACLQKVTNDCQDKSSGTTDTKAASAENVKKDGEDKGGPNSGSGNGGFVDDFDIYISGDDPNAGLEDC